MQEQHEAHAAIWLVIGIQASGKSTVADLLARQFPRAVHVRGGQFYRWAVSGWVHPDDAARQPEARRLLDLRYRLSAQAAAAYAQTGFVTVVQDNVFGADVIAWLGHVQRYERHLVVLHPRLEVVAARDARRQQETGKVAYAPGSYSLDGLQRALDETPPIGLWIDTSEQTPQETVQQIVTRSEDSLLPRTGGPDAGGSRPSQ